MSIRMSYEENSRAERRIGPAFFCDQCHRKITDAGMAIVVWDRNVKPHAIWHLHKLDCDRDFEATHGGHHPWEELRNHVRQLAFGVFRDNPAAKPLLGALDEMTYCTLVEL